MYIKITMINLVHYQDKCEKGYIIIHENQLDELDWLMNRKISEKLFILCLRFGKALQASEQKKSCCHRHH